MLTELSEGPSPAPEALLADAFNLRQRKWDWALSDNQLMRSFSSLRLDINKAHDWLRVNRHTFTADVDGL